MRNSTYSIQLVNYDGTLKADLSDFDAFEYARGFNTVGALTLTLPGPPPPIDRDQALIMRRAVVGQTPIVEANAAWFVTGHEYNDDESTTVIHAIDGIGLLKRRLIAYPKNSYKGTKTVDNNGFDSYADNLIKQFVAENMGPTLDTGGGYQLYTVDDPARLCRLITIAPPMSPGLFPKAEKDGAWRGLLSTITEIADEQFDQLGIRCIFDLTPIDNGTSFYFEVYKDLLGKDRRNEIQFGPDYGNLTEAVFTNDWSEYLTHVYAGGDGQDDDRLVILSNLPHVPVSPFDRFESFIDLRDEDNEIVLRAEANAEINRARRRTRRLAGTIIDGEPHVYGRDFFYGDRVRASMLNVNFDAVIDAISVTVDRDGEDIKIALSGVEAV